MSSIIALPRLPAGWRTWSPRAGSPWTARHSTSAPWSEPSRSAYGPHMDAPLGKSTGRELSGAGVKGAVSLVPFAGGPLARPP